MSNLKQTRTNDENEFSVNTLTKNIQMILQNELVGLVKNEQEDIVIHFLNGRRFRLEIKEEEREKSLLN